MTGLLFPQPVAHRGLHDRTNGIIENSATAFEAAIVGNFAIECDLQLTSDGEVVVFHDDAPKRLLGLEGLVREIDAATLCATPLLQSSNHDCPLPFAEFLTLVKGRTLLQIELKRQRNAEATHALASAAALRLESYAGPATVESFDPELITLVRECGFDGPRGIITYDYANTDSHLSLSDQERYNLRHLLHWHQTQFDFISCEKSALTLPALNFWRELGKPITSWTIRNKAEAEAVKSLCDQIVFEGFPP
ncbi:glycerophosphodiester phosphodiesterase family protein [Devosia rhodophyticola]|uniref:Glycerophosphodiester phosphodiesterase family protein n=1 Tax=Devosia rhodophyticola TaxID=3026423 RepID=A0ABY7YWW3_9HYPH|nr:glycerophosphodiester phosphodiesterase family protein [Devosia rhodophyticola]WDR05702.1 glycerophosphodiester phosphodiesterase family protein [Devosia rhodophyticola]